MTTPNPHADMLRAIADGKQMQRTKGCEWYDCTASVALGLLISVASHTVRVRPEDEQESQEQARLQAEELHLQRMEYVAQMKVAQQRAKSGVQEAVTSSERTIRAFLASRKWPSGREANAAMGVLVEYERFKAMARQGDMA